MRVSLGIGKLVGRLRARTGTRIALATLVVIGGFAPRAETAPPDKGGGQGSCTLPALPPAFSPAITRLNPVSGNGGALYTGGFGQRIAVGEVVRPPDSSRALVVLVPTTTNRAYVFLLDPSTLASLQAPQEIGLPPIDPSRPFYPQYGTVVGDLDGNGVPDFAMANSNPGTVYVLMGSMDGSGAVSYSAIRIGTPAGEDAVDFGAGLAIGNLDPLTPADELVVLGGTGLKVKGSLSGTKAFVYNYSSGQLTLTRTLTPSLNPSWEAAEFLGAFSGGGVGDIDGNGAPDLVLGSPQRDQNGISNSGAVFAFTGTTATPSLTLYASPQKSGDNFGLRLAIVPQYNSLNSSVRDLVVASGSRADLIQGPIQSGPQSAIASFTPAPGLDAGWAYYGIGSADLNGDGVLDFVIPSHFAQFSSACGETGATHVFLSQPQGGWARATIAPPDRLGSRFGTGVAATADGLVFVGDITATVGTTSSAGQVYIYRVNR